MITILPHLSHLKDKLQLIRKMLLFPETNDARRSNYSHRDDFGTQECAKAMDICHAGGVKVNELGTPRLDSIFRIAPEKARYDILMYINADIVFTHLQECKLTYLSITTSAEMIFWLWVVGWIQT